MTGNQNGTAFAAAYEIVTLIARHQVTGPHGEVAPRVALMVGDGGLHIRDVLTLAEADMSIVPVALLNRASAVLGLGDVRKQIVYIAPLYVEEFHILAPRRIRNIRDLAGKTVNVGVKNSVDQQEFESFLSKWGTGAEADRARLFHDFLRLRELSGGG